MIPHDHILPFQCYFTAFLLEHFTMDGARHCLETEEL
jgi:hypothetical protein